jgi:hypothetical protein
MLVPEVKEKPEHGVLLWRVLTTNADLSAGDSQSLGSSVQSPETWLPEPIFLGSLTGLASKRTMHPAQKPTQPECNDDGRVGLGFDRVAHCRLKRRSGSAAGRRCIIC